MTLKINSVCPDFTANTTEGEISFHDFVKVMSKKVTPDYTPDQVVSAFKKFANKKTANSSTNFGQILAFAIIIIKI